jgi:hypothetical protein
LIGRGLSLMNIAGIGGVFVQQMATGLIIGLFAYEMTGGARTYPPDAYRAVFAFFAVQLAVVILIYLGAPDSRSVDEKKNQ